MASSIQIPDAVVEMVCGSYCLLSAGFFGFSSWFLYVHILAPKLLVPVCYSLCGVKKIIDNREKNIYHDKFPMAIAKSFGALVELYLWITCFSHDFPGWEDWRSWHIYGRQQSTDHPEYISVHYPYFAYFVQIFFIFFYDVFKARPKENSIAQYTFDAHHLLTIYLLWGSIKNGYWRWGFLTRFVSHLPMDLLLYSVKIFEYTYKSRTGRDSDCLLAIVMVFVEIIWIILKVVIYGWVCYEETVYYARDKYPDYFSGLLVAASWLLWFLQVIWLIPITQMVLKYVRLEKDTYDLVHADGDSSYQSKKKSN